MKMTGTKFWKASQIKQPASGNKDTPAVIDASFATSRVTRGFSFAASFLLLSFAQRKVFVDALRMAQNLLQHRGPACSDKIILTGELLKALRQVPSHCPSSTDSGKHCQLCPQIWSYI